MASYAITEREKDQFDTGICWGSMLYFFRSVSYLGAKGDMGFPIFDPVKTLMELIFNPCGEIQWSPEGPVRQIQSPHLHVGTPKNFSDLLNSVQMLKVQWGVESNGRLPHLFIPAKSAALVPEFAVEDLPSAELQPRFLHSQWRTALGQTEHSDDNDLHDSTCGCDISFFVYWFFHSQTPTRIDVEHQARSQLFL